MQMSVLLLIDPIDSIVGFFWIVIIFFHIGVCVWCLIEFNLIGLDFVRFICGFFHLFIVEFSCFFPMFCFVAALFD